MDIKKIFKLEDEEETRIVHLILEDFSITTPDRLKHFVTQVLFETANFTKLVENLNYKSAERIVAVWPSRFNLTGTGGKKNAKDYVNNPQRLANLVYANRMGNGSPESGEGFKFRGRGAMHLTGKSNYLNASKEIFGDTRLIDTPDLVSDDKITAIATAAWFWKNNGLNKLADSNSFSEITKRVNGSTQTVPEREKFMRELAIV